MEDSLKKELRELSEEIKRLENLQDKMEEDGVYDDSIYKQIDELQIKKEELEKRIDDRDSLSEEYNKYLYGIENELRPTSQNSKKSFKRKQGYF